MSRNVVLVKRVINSSSESKEMGVESIIRFIENKTKFIGIKNNCRVIVVHNHVLHRNISKTTKLVFVIINFNAELVLQMCTVLK